jgi:hypothetical protein
MEGDRKELIGAVHASTTREVLSFCMRHIMIGQTNLIGPNDEKLLTECANNFTYAYVVVSDSWMKAANANLKDKTD